MIKEIVQMNRNRKKETTKIILAAMFLFASLLSNHSSFSSPVSSIIRSHCSETREGPFAGTGCFFTPSLHCYFIRDVSSRDTWDLNCSICGFVQSYMLIFSIKVAHATACAIKINIYKL